MESENYPLAAITVTVCGQERLMDTKTSRCKYLVITKEKQFFREKPARHPLNQVIKVNNQIMRQKFYATSNVVLTASFQTKMQNLNLIMANIRRWGNSTK